MTRRHRLHPVARLGTLALLLVALVGCGIPQDAEPREISRADLPAELIDPASTQPTLDGDADTRMVAFYLIRPDEDGMDDLVPLRQEIERPTTGPDVPGAVIEALVALRPADLGASDLINALSPDIEVRSAVVGEDRVIDLDLSDLGEAEGTMQRLAVAQLVLTLTHLEVPRIDAVRFSVDGHEVSVRMGTKVVPAGTPVRPSDDPSLPTG